MPTHLHSRSLPDWIDPETAFAALFDGAEHAFWLDSGPAAASGFSYLGDASETVSVSVERGTVTRGGRESAGDIFDALRELLAEPRREPLAGEFAPGWIGWIGYESGAERLGTPRHRSRYPDAVLMRPERMLVFDHTARTVTALGSELGWVDELESARSRVVSSDHPFSSSGPVRWRHDPAAYAELVRRCQKSIVSGDAYQLCLTNEIRVDGEFDALAVYRRLRAGSPSHHGAFIRSGDVAITSASPEQFLRVSPAGRIMTKPIKGTRPRGADVEADAVLRAELIASDKERAENLMIVDLMRNDLGRVAELGSVRVSELLAVESYAQVHQLVSTVEAQLAAGFGIVDLLEAAFPAGSMTGAPKYSAMSILDGLENGPRGIYSGIMGFFGADGAADLAMVIRTIVIDRGGASIGTGGGITALSVPEDEVEETRVKAGALLAALGVS